MLVKGIKSLYNSIWLVSRYCSIYLLHAWVCNCFLCADAVPASGGAKREEGPVMNKLTGKLWTFKPGQWNSENIIIIVKNTQYCSRMTDSPRTTAGLPTSEAPSRRASICSGMKTRYWPGRQFFVNSYKSSIFVFHCCMFNRNEYYKVILQIRYD